LIILSSSVTVASGTQLLSLQQKHQYIVLAVTQANRTSAGNITAQISPQGTSLQQTQNLNISSSPSANAGAVKIAGLTANNTGVNNTGFSYIIDLNIKDKKYPVKYNTTGGNLLGLSGDTDQKTLIAVIGSTADKGKLIIELPRKVVDAKAEDKGKQPGDDKFDVRIDKKGVDYKEVGTNANARIIQIDFSKNDRTIEIVGTRMVEQ
jgi:hypothetical protein